MITENKDRFDRSLLSILEETDRLYYQKDETRQAPKLTRQQAAAADREERYNQFLIWCMVDRYGEYRPFARHNLD